MLDFSRLPYTSDPMRLNDVDAIMAIEHLAFAGAPWSASAYRYELTRNDTAHYLVLRGQHAPLPATPARSRRWTRLIRKPLGAPAPVVPPLPPILAYGGFWYIDEEAHISTIATAPEERGKGLGELLLLALIDRAITLGAKYATLEVRPSNIVAQNLYRKYQFREQGRKRRYYSDNGEDALILVAGPLDRPEFTKQFEALQGRLWARFRAESITHH
jgi:ribosomal-protein-alanine N-acetyltransferase